MCITVLYNIYNIAQCLYISTVLLALYYKHCAIGTVLLALCHWHSVLSNLRVHTAKKLAQPRKKIAQTRLHRLHVFPSLKMVLCIICI